jgi:hypothetical protein
LCITNHENYIIAVPAIELIQNKCSQHTNLLGVFGSMDYSQFKQGLDKLPNPKKIMVTYNSLPKVIKWLETTCKPYEDFKLMVDEYHTLLSDYSYRDEAIDGLLEAALHFNHKCFVSATPITANYCPNELLELEQYEIEWTNTTRIKPVRHKTNKPFACVVNIIKNYKAADYQLPVNVEGRIYKSTEAYFFVNSVKAISDIIENANLSPLEVKIICSDTEKNREILGDFQIDKVSDKNKPFTFITSKAFLGSDFYSESGITYVVSNVTKTNTLYDIATDVFQIAGRIRTKTNPFKNYIYHIYNTGASELTKSEFEDLIVQKKDYTETQISGFSKLSDHEKSAFKKRMSLDLEDDYLTYNALTKQLEYNHLKQLNEEFKFSIVYETYANGLSIRDAYLKSGFDVTKSQLYTNEAEDFIAKATSMQFKEILKEYCDIVDCKTRHNCYIDENRLGHLINLEPSIVDIVKKLGTSKIRTVNYNKKAINQSLYQSSDEVNNAVRIELQKLFKINMIYSSKEVKAQIQSIYNKLKIEKKAKATDLIEYFKIDKKKRNINNKVEDSILIL